MTLTLLLDLDDTLLNTNQDVFFPIYLQTLAANFAPDIDPALVGRALMAGTEAMFQNEDFSRTLREVFEDVFCPQVGFNREELDAHIQEFYSKVFPTLQKHTSQRAETKPFIDWAFSQGFRIVIATDPILPKAATWHRIRWAGLDPEQFDFISTFDNSHFTKSYVSYYAEMLGRIGWQEGPVLMVGNDMQRDILPAKKLGLETFFVEAESGSTSGFEAGQHGTLLDLRRYLESVNMESLIPSYKSREATLAILNSTPAVMDGFLRKLSPDSWRRKPFAGEWTATEMICHLRDTEREIHQMQLKLFEKQGVPFIPRPDTSVWASQRDYLHEDGLSALKDFIEARREMMETLNGVSETGWNQKARHAIFGPTYFSEVAGFFAEHDRLHVHQMLGILKNI